MKQIHIIIALACLLLPVRVFSQVDYNVELADRLFPPTLEVKTQDNAFITILEDYSPGCTKIGCHCQGRPARLGGVTYKRAIGVNSPSRLRLNLDKPAVRLAGKYGVDVGALGSPASVEFVVEAGDRELFHSPLVRKDDKAYNLDVALDNVLSIDLLVLPAVEGPAFDQADWVDLKIEYADGTQEYVNDRCSFVEVSTSPFSFDYGRRSSKEFLKDWNYSVSDQKKDDRILRTVIYTDPDTGLQIKAVVNIYTQAPGIDYTLYLKNIGKADTPIISAFRALDIEIVPRDADRSKTVYCAPDYIEPVSFKKNKTPKLHRLEGTEGYKYFRMDDFMPIKDELSDGECVTFGSEDSYSSSGAFPFYRIEYYGGGVVTALGWSGKWDSSVSCNDGKICSRAGMSEIHTVLYPGEEIRSPRVLLSFWRGDDMLRGMNDFRKTMIRYIVPRHNGEVMGAPVAHMSSCNHQDNSTTAANEKSYIDAITRSHLDFELYWLDAWWHKGGFPQGLGNYVYPIDTPVDDVRFPDGVKDVSDYAKDRGLKFLCWFAPETLSEGSKLALQHPEWILPEGASSGNLNLGNPAALEYTVKYMDDCIKAWGVDVWRTDIGYTLSGIRQMEKDTPDRVGILEIRQVEGLYKLWDSLLELNPGLLIDNCCGGGSRIDLETSQRSISLWRTDDGVWAGGTGNYRDMAILNQNNNCCLNQYVPQSLCATLGCKPYYFRSGFNYGLLFDDDNRDDSYDNKSVAKGIREVKRLRKYVLGDFYPLIFRSYGYDEWCAYQYDRQEEGDGCVLVFRRDESPFVTAELCMRGIDADAKYKVKIYGESYTSHKTVRMKGNKLMKLAVTIDSPPGSALIEYRKL